MKGLMDKKQGKKYRWRRRAGTIKKNTGKLHLLPHIPFLAADDESRVLVPHQFYTLRRITVFGVHYAEKQVLLYYLSLIRLFFAPSPVNYRKVIIN
jgi:hypothetical protein